MVTYCRVLSWERQDQVWILMRPLCLGDKEGICRAVFSRGQRVWEGLLEASGPEGLGICPKAAAMGWRAGDGAKRQSHMHPRGAGKLLWTRISRVCTHAHRT